MTVMIGMYLFYNIPNLYIKCDDDRLLRAIQSVNASIIIVFLLLIFSQTVNWAKNQSDYEYHNMQLELIREELVRLRD